MYAATGRTNLKWEVQIFNWGPGITAPSAGNSSV